MTGVPDGSSVRIVVVGSELTAGRTPDRNGPSLARAVASRGGRVEEIRLLPDDEGALAHAIRRSLEAGRGTLVCGGLGPTPDDRTRRAAAAALGRKLTESSEWRRSLEERGLPTGGGQALLPEGARLVPNPHGTAAAFEVGAREGWLLALPGVPAELAGLLDGPAGAVLDERLSGTPAPVLRIGVAGIPESEVAARLREVTAIEGLEVASDPRLGLVDLRLSAPARPSAAGPPVPGVATEETEARLARAGEALRERFGEDVYEVGERSLEAVVLDRLREEGATLSTAESCTGGWVGRALTAVPGSSDVYWGGAVTYADAAKRELLGVAAETLEGHGAVSRETAREMASGMRRRAGADWSLAITGIAGPGGGSPAKPVGTVWIAVDGPAPAVRRFGFPGGREEVRHRSVHAALDLLRRRLGPRRGAGG